MRLNSEQVAIIKQTAADVFGSGTRVWLFGSRTDDRQRGGDIDLLIVPAQPDSAVELCRKVEFLVQLERQLGEQKIDVVVEVPDDDRPIVSIARATGLEL